MRYRTGSQVRDRRIFSSLRLETRRVLSRYERTRRRRNALERGMCPRAQRTTYPNCLAKLYAAVYKCPSVSTELKRDRVKRNEHRRSRVKRAEDKKPRTLGIRTRDRRSIVALDSKNPPRIKAVSRSPSTIASLRSSDSRAFKNLSIRRALSSLASILPLER